METDRANMLFGRGRHERVRDEASKLNTAITTMITLRLAETLLSSSGGRTYSLPHVFSRRVSCTNANVARTTDRAVTFARPPPL